MEVLDEINYKYHKKEKRVEIEKIQIELIDVFKYLLNLMLIWDIDSQKLIELFNKKSEIVENLFKKTFNHE
jgi:NTP pyrophosphatase (non-canonical NTP hydrolase)